MTQIADGSTTANRGYTLPNRNASARPDLDHVANTLAMIDADVAALLASIASLMAGGSLSAAPMFPPPSAGDNSNAAANTAWGMIARVATAARRAKGTYLVM